MDVNSVCNTCKNESILERKSKKVVRATFQKSLQSARRCDGEILLALIRVFYSYSFIHFDDIQGFSASALRKAITARVKKYDSFSHVFDIANQLPTSHSLF